MIKQKKYCNFAEELDDELNIDVKKIFKTIWLRKNFLIKIFVVVLSFFIILTFILPRKYKVEADLYINKTNNTNMSEINPYFIEEVGSGTGMAAMLAGGGNLLNELEVMRSPLVMDKVIQENNLVYKKTLGFIPNQKEGEYLSTKAFLKKNISIENKKGTNVITIEYTSKKPDVAYNVTKSIIDSCTELQHNIHTGKSKTDLKVLENEYNIAKANLDKKMNAYNGMPTTSLTGAGNIVAMSGFSSAASKALGTLKGQIATGQRSEIALREESEKVTQLATKLEWARLVDSMSDSSKIMVLKEPQQLRDFEYSSPKLLINIILGIVFGAIAALIALIYKEITDKKLSYSMLGDEIIYDIQKDFSDLKLAILSNQDKKISLVLFENIPAKIVEQLKEFDNISAVQADLSKEFIKNINDTSVIILFATIGKTDSKTYKQIKEIFDNMKKKVIKEVLVKGE